MGFYYLHSHDIHETLKGDFDDCCHALSGIVNISFKDDVSENLWVRTTGVPCYVAIKQNWLTEAWYFVVTDKDYHCATRTLKVVLLKHGRIYLHRDDSGFPDAIYRGKKSILSIKEELIK